MMSPHEDLKKTKCHFISRFLLLILYILLFSCLLMELSYYSYCFVEVSSPVYVFKGAIF